MRLCGRGVTATAIRSSLNRLTNLGYISYTINTEGRYCYRVLAKGERFLVAAEALAPMARWLAESGATEVELAVVRSLR